MTFFERILIGITLFYSGLVFTLPVANTGATSYPWWAAKISLGNVLLHEFVFVVWIALYGYKFLHNRMLNGGIPLRQSAILIISLAIWCGVLSLQTPLVAQDIGRSFRLVLMAFLLLATAQWTRRTGDFPVIMVLLGLLSGSAINLLMSFQNPMIVEGVMRLSGQNTPGPGMAIGIHLSAWLFLKTNLNWAKLLSILITLVFIFGAGISFSRVAWIVGALGLLTWVYVLLFSRNGALTGNSTSYSIRKRWCVVVVFLLGTITFTQDGQESIQGIIELVEQKNWLVGNSNKSRMSYFVGTAEIVRENIFGVGYSGFYEAMISTDVYTSGNAVEEVSLEANPHSSFLYYASAGGLIGGVITMILFFLLLNSMRLGLFTTFGKSGNVLFLSISLSYMVIGLTVPYIFNSIILVVPAAIAIGWAWSSSRSSEPQINISDLDYSKVEYAN